MTSDRINKEISFSLLCFKWRIGERASGCVRDCNLLLFTLSLQPNDLVRRRRRRRRPTKEWTNQRGSRHGTLTTQLAMEPAATATIKKTLYKPQTRQAVPPRCRPPDQQTDTVGERKARQGREKRVVIKRLSRVCPPPATTTTASAAACMCVPLPLPIF